MVFPPAYNRSQNSFSHIFAGSYAAGYYSYKWAEVLSADAFSKFEENGVFDRRTGMEFLQHILERGGTEEPMELFVRFRGRKPTVDALLRHAGSPRETDLRTGCAEICGGWWCCVWAWRRRTPKPFT